MPPRFGWLTPELRATAYYFTGQIVTLFGGGAFLPFALALLRGLISLGLPNFRTPKKKHTLAVNLGAGLFRCGRVGGNRWHADLAVNAADAAEGRGHRGGSLERWINGPRDYLKEKAPRDAGPSFWRSWSCLLKISRGGRWRGPAWCKLCHGRR